MTERWSTRKKVLVGLLVALLICCLLVVIIVPSVLLTQKTSTTATTTAATTTTIAPWTLASAYWSFDQTGNDLYATYNGTTTGSYPQTNYFQSQSYYAFGYSLYVTGSQQFTVPSYFNLSYRSFTVEAWIYPTTLSGDNTIFSQCSCTLCTSQCLTLIIRSSQLYIGFNFNDLQGSSILTVNTWYHVAFVYNYATLQQIIYLDGVQDSVRTNVQPYLGQNNSIIIGSQSSTAYYYGYIDNLSLTTRAKSASEISNDATLLFYYSFDLPNQFYDNGPNRLNNTVYSNSASATATVGHLNQAIRMTTTSSYFQMCCFNQIAYSNNKPYTFAVWIYPTSINGGTIVHVAYYYYNSGSGYYSYDVLALTYSGQFVAQLPINPYYPGFVGGSATVNTWTHVACTYSSANGIILYVNGVRLGSAAATSYTNYATPFFVTLGYTWGNPNGASSGASFQGSFDEFYVYRRELSATEILALASM